MEEKLNKNDNKFTLVLKAILMETNKTNVFNKLIYNGNVIRNARENNDSGNNDCNTKQRHVLKNHATTKTEKKFLLQTTAALLSAYAMKALNLLHRPVSVMN